MQRMDSTQNGLALSLLIEIMVKTHKNGGKTTVKEMGEALSYEMLQSKDKPGFAFKTPDSWSSWINQTLLKKLNQHVNDDVETTNEDCFGFSIEQARKILSLYQKVSGGGSRGAKKATVGESQRDAIASQLDNLDLG